MASRGQFVIGVHDLDEEAKKITLPVEPAWLASALEGCEMQPAGPPGLLEVDVSKLGEQVLVRGHVRVDLEAPCARCLKPVHLSPTAPLALLFRPAETETTKVRQGHERKRAHDRGHGRAKEHDDEENEAEAATDALDFEVYDGDHVVLDPYVREAVLLEAPNFPLCSEACSGIGPDRESVGADRGNGQSASALDPRFAPLLRLVKKEAPKE